jgi:pilus assembly protein FimV
VIGGFCNTLALAWGTSRKAISRVSVGGRGSQVMKLKLRIACASLLAAMSLPALALQLGEIQIKSALNQPLVAAIPLHPANLTELDGLSVGLASAEDFARAGLRLTPTDRTLRFRVITDNNDQKLILVTSSQPITDPYLDFLVQVNTRQGKQVREFVVLLNPVIASPAPPVQEAPVAAAPSTGTSSAQAPELPASSSFPQPAVEAPPQASQPASQPPLGMPPPVAQPPVPSSRAAVAPVPSTLAHSTSPGQEITVHRGDTLYRIAKDATQGTQASVDQMMLAMQAANPEAFFKQNINDLKAGAILRIPTRDEIDQRSVAAAAAEAHRQYESWRTAKPHPATVVEGTAAKAAAQAAPKSGRAASASDHLTLVPPTGKAGGSNSRAGVAGGSGTATVNGLRQQLQTDRDTLISLNQSNSDLESRVHNLQDISTKTGKLLSLKDATIAELQHKLAAVQSSSAAAPGSIATTAAGSGKAQSAAKPAGKTSSAGMKPAAKPAQPTATPWYMQPLSWIIAGLVVLALAFLAVFGRRHRVVRGSSRGPLADPDDVAPQAPEAVADEPEAHAGTEDASEDEQFEPTAEVKEPVRDDPYGLAALRAPANHAAEAAAPLPPSEPVFATPPPKPPVPESSAARDPEAVYSEDPVDTKLDLARAYLDMGDPVGARAMLEEVLDEGTQMQQDEARRLLGDIEE